MTTTVKAFDISRVKQIQFGNLPPVKLNLKLKSLLQYIDRQLGNKPIDDELINSVLRQLETFPKKPQIEVYMYLANRCNKSFQWAQEQHQRKRNSINTSDNANVSEQREPGYTSKPDIQICIMTKRGRGIPISDDLKAEMKARIAVMKMEGENNYTIAQHLGCAWETVDKYWDELLTETTETVDVHKLLKERRLVTERLANRSVKDFYAGRCKIQDVAVAFELNDRYTGLAKHLASVSVETLPPLLDICIQQVDVELPPEIESESKLEAVEQS